jgi:hypothetical protein
MTFLPLNRSRKNNPGLSAVATFGLTGKRFSSTVKQRLIGLRHVSLRGEYSKRMGRTLQRQHCLLPQFMEQEHRVPVGSNAHGTALKLR